jgi:endonuclease/exonuclease/phosphatase family metal-dependent hydrolase
VRIATWNILSGRSPGEEAVDEGRFADAVRSLGADLLGLQEVDRAQPRSGHLDLTAVAAEAMGAREWMFAPALTGTPDSWRWATGREAADVPTYGVAFLSRYRVEAWDVIPLPPATMPVPYRWPGNLRPSLVRDEPRVAIVAEVAAPRGPLRVVTTHLSFLPTSNGAQLRLLVRRLAERSGRLVLMGDLNMGPRRADRLTGLGSLATGPTFPADGPTRQIDHLLGRGVTGTGEPVRLGVSDHQALLTEV